MKIHYYIMVSCALGAFGCGSAVYAAVPKWLENKITNKTNFPVTIDVFYNNPTCVFSSDIKNGITSGDLFTDTDDNGRCFPAFEIKYTLNPKKTATIVGEYIDGTTIEDFQMITLGLNSKRNDITITPKPGTGSPSLPSYLSIKIPNPNPQTKEYFITIKNNKMVVEDKE